MTERFEFDGEKYERHSAHQKEWGARLIEELGLKGDEAILDLGCGDGALTARLAELAPRGTVVGIDASVGMMAATKKHRRANLRFELRDIEELEYEGAFDVIFSNATLHWVKDHRKLLANVQRALRPGGVARFNFAGEGNCEQFFAVVREVMPLPEYAEFFTQFEWPWYMPAVADYRTLVEEVAFSETRVWGEKADRYFADAAVLTGWIDQPSIVPFVQVLSDELKPGFRDVVAARAMERCRQPDGTYFVAFRRVNVFARK